MNYGLHQNIQSQILKVRGGQIHFDTLAPILRKMNDDQGRAFWNVLQNTASEGEEMGSRRERHKLGWRGR